MNSPAYWIARQVWGSMLWFMRRPWVKRVRRRMVERQVRRGVPNWMLITTQDRLAHRHGLNILTFCFTLLLGSMFIAGTYLVVLQLYESGLLQPPESISSQLEDRPPIREIRPGAVEL
ncbi:MAG TPA: hypothetical protein PLX06_00365 [Fimbriimonadaceae bacterium]|nr:hypothetical protein [Fimbriimonadaceae bacterium]